MMEDDGAVALKTELKSVKRVNHDGASNGILVDGIVIPTAANGGVANQMEDNVTSGTSKRFRQEPLTIGDRKTHDDAKERFLTVVRLMFGTLESSSLFAAVLLSGMAGGVIDIFLFIRLVLPREFMKFRKCWAHCSVVVSRLNSMITLTILQLRCSTYELYLHCIISVKMLFSGVLIVSLSCWPVHCSQVEKLSTKNTVVISSDNDAEKSATCVALSIYILALLSTRTSGLTLPNVRLNHTPFFPRLKELGGSHMLIGLTRLAMCLSEVPCFYLSGPLIKRVGVRGAISLAQVAYLTRLIYYSVSAARWRCICHSPMAVLAQLRICPRYDMPVHVWSRPESDGVNTALATYTDTTLSYSYMHLFIP